MANYKMYETYKDSGVGLIGEIPGHWKISKIKFTTYVKGRIGWQGLKADEFINEGPYLVTGTDFAEGIINWKSCYHINKKRYDEAPPIQLKEDDLLITKDGTIGKIAIVQNKPEYAIVNSGVFVTRPNGLFYLVKFMYWILNSNIFTKYVDYSSLGSTIIHLYQETFKNFSFPICSLEEQKKIIEFLNNKTSYIDSIIDDKENLINLLKEKRQAIITETVTRGLNSNVKMKDSGVGWIGEIPEHWNSVIFKRIIKGIKDGTHGTHERVNEGELFLCANNIKYETIIISDSDSKISFEEYEKIVSSGYPAKGDILLCCVGTIGRSCVYNYDKTFAFQRSVAFIRLKNNENEYFYNYFIQTQMYQEHLMSYANTSAQSGVYMNNIINTYVLNVPLNEQIQIVKYLNIKVNEINNFVSDINEQIKKLKEYRQSLISEVVTGKVDVRDYYKEG